MRRSCVALTVAALCLLGVAAAPAIGHEAHRTGGSAVGEATAVVRIVVAAVPGPQSSAPPLATFAVLAVAAIVAAALLGYVARQRRRALLVPVLVSGVRLRGPPETRALA